MQGAHAQQVSALCSFIDATPGGYYVVNYLVYSVNKFVFGSGKILLDLDPTMHIVSHRT